MCGFLSRVAGLLRSSSSYRACKPHPGNERPIWPRRECGTRGKWRNACIRGLTATTIVPAAVAKTRMLGASHWTRRRLDTRELPPRGWEVNSGGAGFSKPLPRQQPRLLFRKFLHFSRKSPPLRRVWKAGVALLLGRQLRIEEGTKMLVIPGGLGIVVPKIQIFGG
ncbi:hypothetical protein TcCL_Unassigned01171 [Trypanosoma cruzi]|nr:hypothetical protein TcCL_Unassigned01171 [Trypanosoma cruzi]